MQIMTGTDIKSFHDLGVCKELVKACQDLGWDKPTQIQQDAIPLALKKNDLIGLAKTGSGKTGAFALPVIQDWLLEGKLKQYFCLVLSPTRELALQIEECFSALAGHLGLRCLSLVGGIDIVDQAVEIGLARCHVIVGTPGRLVDHLENSRGFRASMSTVKHLVVDEADRMLSLEFTEQVDKVLAAVPKATRQTQLFSASMTKKVDKLRRTALRNPVTVEAATKYATVDQLSQFCLPTSYQDRELYLDHLVRRHLGLRTRQTSEREEGCDGSGILIFCRTCSDCWRLALFLRNRFIRALPLNSRMSQHKRSAALDKFSRGERDVLVATDVASRGLDIPRVGLVVNFDVPGTVKTYLHRVGRTARAGNTGQAVTMVTLDAQSTFREIEQRLKLGRLPVLSPPIPPRSSLDTDAVDEAIRLAAKEMKLEIQKKGGLERQRDLEDEEEREFLKVDDDLKRKRLKNKHDS